LVPDLEVLRFIPKGLKGGGWGCGKEIPAGILKESIEKVPF